MSPIICDTSALLAYFDAAEPDHEATVAAVDAAGGALVVSTLVLAELDHFLNTRYPLRDELAVLDELSRPSWTLAPFAAGELRAARVVIARYPDQRVGLTDASIVVLAQRYRTDRVLTLDHRHFSVLRTSDGQPFTLLP